MNEERGRVTLGEARAICRLYNELKTINGKGNKIGRSLKDTSKETHGMGRTE